MVGGGEILVNKTLLPPPPTNLESFLRVDRVSSHHVTVETMSGDEVLRGECCRQRFRSEVKVCGDEGRGRGGS